jgi:hypothetical protein
VHKEFSHIVKDFFEKTPLSQLLPADWDASDLVEIKDFSFDSFDCPSHVEGDIYSPIALLVVAKLYAAQKNSGADITPLEFAENVLAILKKEYAQYFEYFSIEVGGTGFLNATATEKLKTELFQKLSVSELSSWFGASSILFGNSSQMPELAKPIYSIAKVLARAKKKTNEDALVLVQKIEADSLPDRDDLIMLLAVSADENLDVDSYLAGLAGRENIPWLFQKVAEDISSFISILSSEKVDSEKSWQRIFSDKRFSEAVQHILHFRKNYIDAVVCHRPDLLVGYLVSLIKYFYSFYNRLDVRSVPEQDDFLLKDGLCRICQLIKLILDFSLSELSFTELNRN